MNLIQQREPHAAASPMASGLPGLEPFGLMRNLLRWDPFRDMEGGIDLRTTFTPSFDIRETPAAFLFEADLPGIRNDDLDINLTGNRLNITGKRESTTKGEGENVFTMERSFGCFCRSFTLPEGVDANGINAELKDGVLTVKLPKLPEIQPKKISLAPGH